MCGFNHEGIRKYSSTRRICGGSSEKKHKNVDNEGKLAQSKEDLLCNIICRLIYQRMANEAVKMKKRKCA